MNRAHDDIFAKTERGLEELKSRRHGLNPRARQLLILVDGRRCVEQLARLLPRDELDAYIALLDEGGFIERLPPLGPIDDALADPAEFASARQSVARVLLDLAGPGGDEFATRIARCTTPAELNELLPAAASIVEAIRGRVASRNFAARVGLRPGEHAAVQLHTGSVDDAARDQGA